MIYVIFILGYFGGKRKGDNKKSHTHVKYLDPSC